MQEDRERYPHEILLSAVHFSPEIQKITYFKHPAHPAAFNTPLHYFVNPTYVHMHGLEHLHHPLSGLNDAR